MWSLYHPMRTSKTYLVEWLAFLKKTGNFQVCHMFCQYVGHRVFKELIKLSHPLDECADITVPPKLTYEETNALRYAAGYVPRALKQKLSKSAHPLKEYLQLCILDLLDDGDEETSGSQDWVDLIDCGGLTRVNNTTFEVFLAMECELRRHLHTHQAPNLGNHVTHAIIENEDVQFLWSILRADWEEESGAVLLQMVVNQWVKIRGFSFASCWVEKYKAAQRKTTQKSKGVRKQLLPKPNAKKAKTDSAACSDPE